MRKSLDGKKKTDREISMLDPKDFNIVYVKNLEELIKKSRIQGAIL